MKSWVNRAFGLLQASLEQPKHELNELDWKFALSPDKKRLAEHLSAFANYPGGGFLIYGVDASGKPDAMDEAAIQTTINQLANIGRQGVEPSVSLDHAVEDYESVPLLFVRIPEASVKPVHIRGKGLEATFIRSGGTTRQASRQEIGTLMLHSRTPRWEELHSSVLLTDTELLSKLNIEPILSMMERPVPTTNEERLNWMVAEGFIFREPAGGGYVTNLGAISAARRLADFPDLARKAVRIVVYDGLNKSKTKREQEGAFGYAIGFQGIIQFLTSLLPQSEVIEKALRVKRTVYPEIALRELVANALIHQDFSVSGVSPLIEIFDDRIEISNPGGLLPSKQLDRLIGTQPESRNEKLASAFRRYKICEERGSGLIKAGQEVEIYGLPPIEFYSGPNYFKVTLYCPRTFAQMSAHERLEACYQHAVLKYFSDSAMTNKSLRERLKMPEKQRSMVSNLIQEAISLNRIKPANPDNKSKKFTEYVPFWA
ncbi:MAG TPA: ATP-binding protein [Verrucomicrobiae bacterium]|nr:ATP-binding protein [Verrucomicrobiae bacterium]